MTTIAYDGISLAADGQITSGDTIVSNDSKKIVKLDDVIYTSVGRRDINYIAIAGDADTLAVLRGIMNDELDDQVIKAREFHAIYTIGKKAYYLYVKENERGEVELHDSELDTKFAIGSGRDYALTAMHMGKTAREAVKVACELDIYSSGKIQNIKL